MQAKGSFTIVLSGGSLLKALVKLVENPRVDWSKWHVAYADERNVSHNSDDSNHKGAKDAFLDKVGLHSHGGLPALHDSLTQDKWLFGINQLCKSPALGCRNWHCHSKYSPSNKVEQPAQHVRR